MQRCLIDEREDAAETTGGSEMTDLDTETKRSGPLDSLTSTPAEAGTITVDPVAEAVERRARVERRRSRLAFGAVVAVALGIAGVQSYPQWGPNMSIRVAEQLAKVPRPAAAAAQPAPPKPQPSIAELAPMNDLNLALGATAEATRTARSTKTDDGRRYYSASNVLDDDPATVWRAVGGAKNKELTLTFNSRVKVTSVGLINGYSGDGYLSQRRITQVTWMFDNGMSRTQFLRDDNQQMQSIYLGSIPTKVLRLRIDATTEPGPDGSSDSSVSSTSAPAPQDFTTISDVRVMGSFCTVNGCPTD